MAAEPVNAFNQVISQSNQVDNHVFTIPPGKRLAVDYVSASFGSETVSVIDTNTLMVIRSPITFGWGPLGVAVTPNGARVYVSNHMSDNVSVIDTATNALVATIPVGLGPYGVPRLRTVHRFMWPISTQTTCP